MKPHKYSHLLSALVVVARKYHNFDSLREHLNLVLCEFIPVEHGSKGVDESQLRLIAAHRISDLAKAEVRVEQAEKVFRLLRCIAKDYDCTGTAPDLSGVLKELGVFDQMHDELAPEAPVANMPDTLDVFDELDRAAAKFPTWPDDPFHAFGVLAEEFGELIKALNQTVYEPHKSGLAQVRAEAVQTAAMALRFIQGLDRYQYRPSTQHDQPSRERNHG